MFEYGKESLFESAVVVFHLSHYLCVWEIDPKFTDLLNFWSDT